MPTVDTCRSPATAQAQLSRRCTEKKRGCRVTVHRRTTRAADTPTPTLRRGEVRRHNRFDASLSHVPPRFGAELRARASPKAPERAHRTSRFPCTRVGRRERGSPKVASDSRRDSRPSIAGASPRRTRDARAVSASIRRRLERLTSLFPAARPRRSIPRRRVFSTLVCRPRRRSRRSQGLSKPNANFF